MTEMGHIWWMKVHSTSAVSGVSGTGSDAGGQAGHHRRPSSSCCLRKFVRKLKKHSKLLCSATRPTTFHCHYDPLSYARNFDHSDGAFDDGSNRFYAFSSRFVLSSASAAPPVIAAVH